ncbi:MAG: hypothetical protein FJW90_07315 [Actinobacteria bacterium]|nr:hypothetical protein [Actinomycetota bacterium]
MKGNLKLLTLFALAAGLIAAGCGDDDGSSDLTHEEFVTQANAICKEGNAEIDAAAEETFEKNGQPTQAESDAFVTDTIVPNVQGQISDIRDLGIPEEDEDLNGTLDEAEEITDGLTDDPASFTQGDPYAPINDELRAAGLTECADG